MAALNSLNISKLPHHEKKNICASRAKYREGRKDTSVKVYTINQESVYLLIQGIPAVGAQDDLKSLCEQYGILDDFKPLDEYPCEEFTEVCVVKYNWFSAARTAKKHLDDKSFFGGTLHVCYAPEFETAADTRKKLNDRRKFVAWRGKGAEASGLQTSAEVKGSNTSIIGKQKLSTDVPFKSCDNNNNTHAGISPHQPITYVWAGKEYTVYPQSLGTANSEHNNESVNQMNSLPLQSCSGSLQKTVALKNDEISYSRNMANIRKKVHSLSVPNMRVGFKRRKKI